MLKLYNCALTKIHRGTHRPRPTAAPALLLGPDHVKETASHMEPAGAPEPALKGPSYPITSIFIVPAGRISNFVTPTENRSNSCSALAAVNPEVGGGLQVIRLDSERYSSASLKLSLPHAASVSTTTPECDLGSIPNPTASPPTLSDSHVESTQDVTVHTRCCRI